MRYCKECGEKLTDNQRVCPICGTAVQDSDASAGEEQTVFEKAASQKPKKSNRLKIILSIAAGVVAVGIVFLVLFLTGVFKQCKPTDSRSTDGQDSETADSEILAPSKEKIAQLEKRNLTAIRDKAFEQIAFYQSLSFDADVTLESDSDGGAGRLSTADFLNNAKLQLRMDNRSGKDLGVSFLLWNNPIIDLRAFDLDREQISVYSSARSDKIFTVSVNQIVELLASGQVGQAQWIRYALRMILSDNLSEKLKPETDLLIESFINAILSCNVDIQTDQSVLLFDGDETVDCEVYTMRPTAEQVASFLNSLIDLAENENGYLSELIRLSGFDSTEAANARKKIPEIAQQIYESGLEFAFAVKGNEIVRTAMKNNNFSFVCDTFAAGTGKRFAIRINAENFAADMEMKKNDDGTVELKTTANRITVTGSCRKDRKSLIGTYEGRFEVTVDSQKAALIEITPSDQGMMHRISLDRSVVSGLSLDNNITVFIDVKPATGIQRPNGAETVDATGFSAEELTDMFHSLIAPIELMLGMGL